MTSLVEDLTVLGAAQRLHVSEIEGGVRLERGPQVAIVRSFGSKYQVSVGAHEHIGSPLTLIPPAFRELSNLEDVKAYLTHIAQEMHG
jgi:hypothetical protein